MSSYTIQSITQSASVRSESQYQKSLSSVMPSISSGFRNFPTIPKDINLDYEVTPVPSTFPKLNTVKLPFVREIGVKESIRKLAEIYGCKKFQCNLLQFWFIDFMTDCLWKVQDEFQFPEEHQQVIMEWIGFAFNLFRSSDLNLSRKKAFRTFNEAINVAEQHIETGCATLPLPEELFTINAEDEDGSPHIESDSSISSLESEDPTKNNSYLAIKMEDGVKFFNLPTKICPWDTDDDRLSTTIETVSENEIVIVKPPPSEKESPEEEEVVDDGQDDVMFEDFYKPDMRTPPRFVPSEESFYSDSISISYESESIDLEEDDDELAGPPVWIMPKKKVPDVPCPSKLFDDTEEYKEKTEKEKEEEAIQGWYDYHLWQYRKLLMEDPEEGWVIPSEEQLESKFKTQEVQTDSEFDQVAAHNNLQDYVKAMHDDMKEIRENRFINTCAILAIKQIVYNYFYDSFQFSLIKLAYREPQCLTTQELNKDWCIPKKIKGEVKRPKPKKVKVEKPKKEKHHKDSHDKKEKDAGKKSGKEEHKKDLKHEEITKKGEKHIEPPKKEKKMYAEPTKEELEFLEFMRMEQDRLALLEQIAEENKTTVFPLSDAVDETFFEKIFSSFKSSRRRAK